MKFRSASWLAWGSLIFWTTAAWPCLERLITPPKFNTLRARAVGIASANWITRGKIDRLLTAGPYLPIVDPDGSFWMVVFDTDKRNDAGYSLNGHKNADGELIVDTYRLAAPKRESTYLKKLAYLLQIKSETLNLKQGVLNCHSVFVSAKIKLKLWLKHRLGLGDVAKILDHPESSPALSPHQHEDGDTYDVFGTLPDQRKIRAAVINFPGECRQSLATAFTF